MEEEDEELAGACSEVEDERGVFDYGDSERTYNGTMMKMMRKMTWKSDFGAADGEGVADSEDAMTTMKSIRTDTQHTIVVYDTAYRVAASLAIRLRSRISNDTYRNVRHLMGLAELGQLFATFADWHAKSRIISLFTARSYRSHSGKVELSNYFWIGDIWKCMLVNPNELLRSRPGMLTMWCFLVLLS